MPTTVTHHLHILAVEDDAAQAQGLRLLLTRLGYELVGVAATQAEALALFDELQPDLVLLDIHLRGTDDGIAVAHQLNARRVVPLIFLTSYADDATFTRARATGPAAFLAKPYGAALLHHAIELAVEQYFRQRHGPAVAPEPGTGPGDVFFVRDRGQIVRVRYADVRRVEADASYVHLHTAQRRYTVRNSLRQVAEQLPPGQFVQIHRTWLVRLTAIETIDYGASQVQVDSHVLPLGATWRDELRRQLPRLE